MGKGAWTRLCFLSLGLLLEGCTAAVAVWPETQSRATSPYDRIVPLAEAKGSTTGFDLSFSGIPDFIDPELGKEAVHRAIRSQRADLLTDYSLSLYLVQISSPFNLTLFGSNIFPSLWIITWTAEGVAARIEGPAAPAPVAQLGPSSKGAGR
jgi:hypothetical protein